MKILRSLLCLVALAMGLNSSTSHGAAPSAPENVQSFWLVTESLLTWGDVSGAASYSVYRSDDTNTAWTLVASGVAVPRFRDVSLQFLPSYYVVTAVNTEGESAASQPSTVAFAEPGFITVYQPSRWEGTLSATNAIIRAATSDVNGAQGMLDWGLNATNYTQFVFNGNFLGVQTFALTNLLPLTSYYYRLTSLSSNHTGVSYLGYFETPDTNHRPVLVSNVNYYSFSSETASASISYHAIDTDFPPQSISYRITSTPTNGTLSGPYSGWSLDWGLFESLSYQPNVGARGLDHLSIVANDGIEDSIPMVITLSNWLNRIPTAGYLQAITAEDTPVTVHLNDIDPDGDTVSFSIGLVSGGTISGTGPDFVFTPNTNSFGSYNGYFTYQVTDSYGTNQGYVSFDVTPVNDKPEIRTEFMSPISTWEDQSVSFWLQVYDVDWTEGYQVIQITPPAHGTLTGDVFNLVYTPATNFFGTDSFTISVREGNGATSDPVILPVEVLPRNDEPYVFDQNLVGFENIPLVIPPLVTDIDSTNFTFYVVQPPAHGYVLVTASNILYRAYYTNFVGNDSFYLGATDDWGFSSWAHPGLIQVQILDLNNAPVASDGNFLFHAGTAALRPFLVTDDQSGELACQIVSAPTNGTVVVQGGTNFLYTPGPGSQYPDAFTYRVSDGTNLSGVATIHIWVAGTNTPPIAQDQSVDVPQWGATAVLLAITDIDSDDIKRGIMEQPPVNGAVEFFDTGYILYSPLNNYHGQDSFTYRAYDGFSTGNIATVHVTVRKEYNTPPNGYDHFYTIPENTFINLFLPMWDAEYDFITWVLYSAPTNGMLIGTLPGGRYVPNTNFVGTDIFKYRGFDGEDYSSVKTVTITVTNVNQGPVANSVSFTTAEDVPANITLTASDLDNDPLTFTVITNPAHGTLSGTVPSLLFTPATNYFGNDSFVFRVSDGFLNSTATVNVSVSPVNDLLAPENLRRRTFDDGIVRLWWHAVPGAQSYSVYRADGSNAPFTLLASGVTVTNFNDSTVQWRQPYRYHVRTWDGTAEGQPSNPVYAFPDTTGLLDLFTDIWIIRSTTANVQFTSSMPDGAEGILEYGTTRDYGNFLENTNIYGFQRFIVSNLTPAAIYYFRFTATDIYGNAIMSSTNRNGPDWFKTMSPPIAFNQTNSVAEDSPYGPALAEFTGEDSNWPLAPFLSYSLVAPPLHGTVLLLTNDWGVTFGYSYTPATNFFGADTFSFRANNGELDSTPATVTMNVLPWNDPPVASNISITSAEDTVATIPISFSDVDGGETAVLQIVSEPEHGTAEISGTNLVYLPATNYFGADSFSYQIFDGLSWGNVATVSITVSNMEDAPISFAQPVTAVEDANKAITLTGVDPDGDSITFSIINPPSNGTLSGTPPNVTYVPATNYYGADSFTFRAYDGKGFGAPATVSINVTAVNDPPVASAQSFTLVEDSEITFTLSGSDVDSGALSYEVLTQPTNGTLSIAGTNYTYRPVANFNGGDSLAFRATDGSLWSAPATVTFTVTALDDAPSAFSESVSVAEDGSRAITLAGSDGDGETLTYSIVTAPSHGTLSGVPPNVTYQPDANYDGADSFTFRVTDGNTLSAPATVSITVTAINDAPTAPNRTFTIDEDAPLNFTLGGSDVDGDTLTARLVSSPNSGTITTNGNSFTYTPNANFNGTDSFFYTVNDSSVDGNTASVIVTITAVDDAPVPNPQSVTTSEDTAKAITLAASDADGEPITWAVTTAPEHGTLTGTAPNLVYQPTANFFGSDSLVFRVSNGTTQESYATVSITVTPVNDAPVASAQSATTAEDTASAIALGATDAEGDSLTFSIVTPPAHGSLSGTLPNVTYQPDANYNGQDSFSFRVTDGNAFSAPATVLISVTAINDAPTAPNRTFLMDEDASLNFALGGSDVDADTLTARLVSLPNSGTIVTNGNSFTYTPNANFNGTDSFFYTVNDGSVDGNTASVSITVEAVDDAPVASPQSVITSEDTSKSIILTANDTDDGPIMWAVATPPAHGTLTGIAPNLVYTPAPNFFGSDSFVFRVSNGTTQESFGTVSITVNPVNDGPVANTQSVTTAEDAGTAIILAASDVEGDALTFSIVTPPAHGALSGTAPNLTYTPVANYNGPDSFTFRANDGSVFGNIAVVSITVNAANDAPVANAQSVSVTYNTAQAITLSGSDVDGNPLTYSVMNGPSNGALSGTASNLAYTPNIGYAGADSLSFRVNDGTVNSAVATVSITVLNPASTPAAPSGMTATAVSSSQINLSWTDNSSNEDGVRIERSINGSSWSEIGVVGPNVRNFSSTGLSANKTYYFRVRAYNRLGNSTYSNTASAKTLK